MQFKKLIVKAMAIALVISLTAANILVVGLNAVSYAADAIGETNSENVTFDVYFKDESGNILTSKEENISNSEIKLYVQIAVKNEGYFNGTISLGESNFNLKENNTNEKINKVEENTITLNQINAGEVVELELGVEAKSGNRIISDFLSMTSEVKLNGTYKDSTEKDVTIEAQREVVLNLASPYEEGDGLELTSQIITNKIYEINGENKRVVQVLIESGLRDNAYPIKATNIQVTGLEGAEEVEVITRGTEATNGKGETEFNESNWEYAQSENKVTIEVENQEEEGTISWSKGEKDSYIVTYILGEETETTGKEITVKAEVSLYDTRETVKTGETTSIVEEEIDGIVETKIETEESSIYKGKIYSGEEREYKVTTKIYASSNKTGEEIEIELSGVKYETEETSLEANVEYRTSVISKEQIERVLGEEGELKILNANSGETIAEITKDTEADENGEITITYPEGIKAIKVETSQITGTGTIEIDNTKVIKQESYSRETIRTIKSIKEVTTGAEATIELKETTAEAKLEINSTSLSTLSTNENVEIKAILLTDNEKYDLYKNPVINIALPSCVQDITIKSIKPVYADDFVVAKATLLEENGQKVIQIALEGEQTKYTNEVNQTTLVITADISFGILTPSQTQEISMNYTNENGIEDSYNTSLSVNIESKYGLMMYSNMQGYNEEGEVIYTINSDVPTGTLDMEATGKTATIGTAILNNYGEDITDVTIIGRIPAKGVYDGTIDTTLLQAINTSINDVTILYSTNAQATANDGSWTTDWTNAKSFMLQLDTMQKEQVIQLQYKVAIPDNLGYGQSLYAKVEMEYAYLGNSMSQNSTLGATTEKLSTVNDIRTLSNVMTMSLADGLTVSIAATTGGNELQDGDSVYEGQSIKYFIEITNNTGEDLTNVNVQAVQENGNIYDLQEVEVTNPPVYGDNEVHIEYRYTELDTNTKTFDTIETLADGESMLLTYEIVVNEVEEEATTKGEITINADDNEEVKINTISNNIQQGELKLNLFYNNTESVIVYSEESLFMGLNVENITDDTLKKISVEIELPEKVSFEGEENLIVLDQDSSVMEQDERISNINYDEEKNILTFDIENIEAGEIISAIIILNVLEFEEDARELSFIAKAVVYDENTYISNQFIKEVINKQRDVTITQTIDRDINEKLKDGDNVQLTITVINNSSSELYLEIQDLFPNGLEIQSGKIKIDDTEEELEVLTEDEENTTTTFVKNNILLFYKYISANSKMEIIIDVVIDTSKITEETITNTVDFMYGEAIDDENLAFTVEMESELTLNIQLANGEAVDYVEVVQTATPVDGSYISDGQEIVYTTEITNISSYNIDISIMDYLPYGIDVNQVFLNGSDVTDIYLSENILNIYTYYLELNATAILEIRATFNEINARDTEFSNSVYVETPEKDTESNVITYYLEQIEEPEDSENPDSENPDEENPENPDSENPDGENPENPDSEDSGTGSDTETTTYIVSGVAWLDSNKNGMRDSTETLLPGIEVKLLNIITGEYVQSNGQDLTATTSDSGYYQLEAEEGSYIVIFIYDTNRYSVTEYQKDGVQDTQNSDAISRSITIDGVSTTVGVTDTIELEGQNVENIDIGLIENEIFDLELDKYVTKITVQNGNGTTTYNYSNETLAKVEIDAKQLNNSTVIIEYQIKVTNMGELAGYVEAIVDYMPTELDFSSEMNTDWYQIGSNLYNTSLTNTELGVGESQTVTLILTKTMTENNTGRVSNTAEIADAYNSLGISDTDSTPGNGVSTEDDYGQADVIISIRTGALIAYTGVVIAILAIIGLAVYFINKKILKEEI